MGSIFWGVLYFRSHKNADLFHILTSYLLHHHVVGIPHVGRFSIERRPAEYSVADHQVLPPTFKVKFVEESVVDEKQVKFLSSNLKLSDDATKEELENFGLRLQRSLEEKKLDLKEVEIFRSLEDGFTLLQSFLGPVPARKVIRKNAEHQVLVGDKELTSRSGNEQETEAELTKQDSRSYLVPIAWILLACSIIFITIMLFLGKFEIVATGLRRSATGF